MCVGAIYIYIYIYPHGRTYVILWMYECVCLCIWRKVTLQYSAGERVLIYWLCQRIPSDQVQFSSPALISSAHQGFFSRFLSASLPHSYPSSCFSFDCHPLANPDHTIEPNHIWQFKLALFSLSLALQNTSQQNGPRASAAPTLFGSHLSARKCVCACHFFWMLLWA